MGKIEIASLCFWCGSEIGKIEHEVAEGEVAPKRAVTSYQPCKACKEKFSKGIAIFETKEAPYYEKQPPLFENEKENAFPSGRWIILPVEVISTVFADEAAQEFKRTKQGYVNEEVFKLIQGNGEQPTQH